ncbi:MAG: SAV_6107 family HEPN domain-containing protein, partial [Pseudonocardiaceae bacterium]
TTPTEEADVPTAALPTAPVVPLSRYNDRIHPPHAARTLLDQARQGLVDAEYTAHPVDRYIQAHLAALRAATAVLAARTTPRRRTRPTSVWVLLATVVPELAEWSAFFAATAAMRSAAEAGVRRLVTQRDADDLVRQAREFLNAAQRAVPRNSS